MAEKGSGGRSREMRPNTQKWKARKDSRKVRGGVRVRKQA